MKRRHGGLSLRCYYDRYVSEVAAVMAEKDESQNNGKVPKTAKMHSVEEPTKKDPDKSGKESQASGKESQATRAINGETEAERLLRLAPRSEKAAHLCKFRCPHCQVVFNSWTSLHLHDKRKAHSGCPGIRGRGVRVKWEELAVEVVAHECRMCGQLVPCDKDKITLHLTHNHPGIKAKWYRDLVDSKGSQGSPKEFMEGQVARQARLKQIPLVPPGTFADFTVTETSSPGDTDHVSFEVANLCTFKCEKCSQMFECFDGLGIHRNKCVGANKGARYACKSVVFARAHMCHICLRRILCDTVHIHQHVTYSHKMIMPEYTSLVRKNIDSSSSEEDFKRKMELRLQSLPPGKNKKVLYETASLRDSVPLLQPTLPYCSKPADSVPLGSTTLSTKNLCTFQCPRCSPTVLFYSYTAYREHVKKKSCILSKSKECSNWRGHVKEARYHFCGLCARRILADTTIISRHIGRCHKGTSMQSYVTFMRKNRGKHSSEEEFKQKIEQLCQNKEASKISAKELAKKKFHTCKDLPLHKRRKFELIQNTPVISPNMFSKSNATNSYRGDTETATFEIANLSVFKCNECGKKYGSIKKLRVHRKTCAKNGFIFKSIRYTYDSIVTARAHMCHICLKKILCDNSLITEHVHRYHKMTLSEYSLLVKKNLDSFTIEEFKRRLELRLEHRPETNRIN